jgi:glycine oxidase
VKIGIAGAGLVGRLMAWRLARQGHQVSLFDGDTRSGEASAGMTAAAAADINTRHSKLTAFG